MSSNERCANESITRCCESERYEVIPSPGDNWLVDEVETSAFESNLPNRFTRPVSRPTPSSSTRSVPVAGSMEQEMVVALDLMATSSSDLSAWVNEWR